MRFWWILSSLLVCTMGCSFKKNPRPLISTKSSQSQTEIEQNFSDIDRLFNDLRIKPIPDLLKNLDKISLRTLESRDSSNLTVLDHAIARGNTELIGYLLSREISPFRFKTGLSIIPQNQSPAETESSAEEVVATPDEVNSLIISAQKSKLNEIENIAVQNADVNSVLRLVRDTEALELGCISILNGIHKSRIQFLRHKTGKPRDYLDEVHTVLNDQSCGQLAKVERILQKQARVWLSEELKNLYIHEITSNEDFAQSLVRLFSIKNAVVYSNLTEGRAVSPAYLITLVKDCRYRLNPRKQEWLHLIGSISDASALSSEQGVYDPSEEEYLKPGIPIGQYQAVQREAVEKRAENRQNAIDSLGIAELIKSKKFETCENYYEE